MVQRIQKIEWGSNDSQQIWHTFSQFTAICLNSITQIDLKIIPEKTKCVSTNYAIYSKRFTWIFLRPATLLLKFSSLFVWVVKSVILLLSAYTQMAPWLCAKSPPGLFCICVRCFSVKSPRHYKQRSVKLPSHTRTQVLEQLPGGRARCCFFFRITQVAAKWQGKFCAAAARIPVAARENFSARSADNYLL